MAIVYDLMDDHENAIYYYGKSLAQKADQKDIEEKIQELQNPE
jgi:hypothetical protein